MYFLVFSPNKNVIKQIDRKYNINTFFYIDVIIANPSKVRVYGTELKLVRISKFIRLISQILKRSAVGRLVFWCKKKFLVLFTLLPQIRKNIKLYTWQRFVKLRLVLMTKSI